MYRTTDVCLSLGEWVGLWSWLKGVDLSGSGFDQSPDALQKSELPFHIGVIPFEIFFGRGLEQDEHPGRVGSVTVDHRSWINAVVLRLRHLLEQHLQWVSRLWILRLIRVCNIGRGHIATSARIAVGRPLDHSLGEKTIEWFIHIQQAPILEGLGEKTGIEQVKNGVLDATHVLPHRQPAVCCLSAERCIRVVRIGEPQEIPGGTHKRVHGVGFPATGFSAVGAWRIDPRLLL